MHIIDISNDLLTAEVYEDDPVPKLQSVRALEKGDPYTLNALYAGLHNGTRLFCTKAPQRCLPITVVSSWAPTA